jgi:dipeptidyl aminopeptidase/acylaminoacyl peptidase
MKPSPDGKNFAFTTNLTGLSKDAHLSDIWIYDVNKGKARQLTSRLGAESGIIWSFDGQYILFSGWKDPKISSSQTDLFMISSKGGEPINLTEEFDRSVSNVIFLPNGRELVMTVAEGFYTHFYHMDIDSKKMTPLIKEPTIIGNICLAKKARKLVFTRQNSRTLQEIYISDLDCSNSKKLTNFSSQLEDYKLASQKVISWKSRDKIPIEGLLVYPMDYTPSKKFPLIVNPHGGPHGRVQNSFSGTYQVLAAHGYAILSPNFRGSSGYGADFDVANIKDLGFGDFQDIMTGVDTVIEMGVADPERMGIMGGSYGGYMTNWTITQTDRFKAAVSMYGIFNMITDFSNSNIPRWEVNYLNKFYWDDLDIYFKHSPANYVKNIKTPVLIMQGQDDPNTVLSNSREMHTALKFLNKTVEFVVYPREKHGIRGEPNHILDKYRRILEWFDKYILEKPDTIPVGQAAVEENWKLKVLEVNAEPCEKDNGNKFNEVTVNLELRFIGEKESDFPLNLSQDVCLCLKDDYEVSPIGILVNTGGSENLFITSELTLSRAKSYHLKIVFKVPSTQNKAKFRLKDFPSVLIQF